MSMEIERRCLCGRGCCVSPPARVYRATMRFRNWVLLLIPVVLAAADRVLPVSYSGTNGELGPDGLQYRDDLYSGTGADVDASYLSNGLGQLADGDDGLRRRSSKGLRQGPGARLGGLAPGSHGYFRLRPSLRLQNRSDLRRESACRRGAPLANGRRRFQRRWLGMAQCSGANHITQGPGRPYRALHRSNRERVRTIGANPSDS